jgi:hypothetical protein
MGLPDFPMLAARESTRRLLTCTLVMWALLVRAGTGTRLVLKPLVVLVRMNILDTTHGTNM